MAEGLKRWREVKVVVEVVAVKATKGAAAHLIG